MSHSHPPVPASGDSGDDDDPPATSNPEVLRALVDNHRRFLTFLEKRLGDRTTAEDILQGAFVRGVERAPEGLDAESAVYWFFRVLRNALVDHHRRRLTAERVSSGIEAALGDVVVDDEARAEACRCILSVADTLKPEYSMALRRVDVEGASVQAFAGEAGISANNASVRLFRARRALKERLQATCRTCHTHGCLDCTCATTDRS